MFFRNANDPMMEVYSVVIEIEISGTLQRKTMNAPRVFIEQEFLSLIQFAQRNNAPVKLRMYRTEKLWSQFDQKMISCENEIVIKNTSYMNMEKKWEK